ncbi:MAG: FecR domain-containing protein, partial [Deltaproteobacteria bacterium]|nr:FecR domain-containing protein [Deltaproteobacteria bacterium]
MKHVAPHRWADLWAGRVDAAERTAMERHASACPACAKTRERVTRASDTFASIKNLPLPELSWDSVRAKVHWSVSTERRAKVPAATNSRAGWIAAGMVAAAAVATLFVDRPAPPAPPAPIAMATPRTPESAPAIALAGLVNRTTGDLMVDGIRPVDPFAGKLAAGQVIATGDGRVDVQFGAGSAFRLGPHSRLQLVRFDSQAIELVVDGTLDLEVAPRLAGQRFVVRAGAREIEVRGTQFRVHHQGGATSVACRHGLVSVRDTTGAVEVGAARRLVVPSDKPVTGERIAALSIEEVSDLADATPMTMPLWHGDALASSAPLE